MKLNKDLLSDFKASRSSKLLAVTKYWGKQKTQDFLSLLSEDDKNLLV
jgi:hypothetical protein